MSEASLTEQFLAREAALLEETKRFNAEREIAKALAPRKWTEFKRAFQEHCAKLERTALCTRLECEDFGDSQFFLNRLVRGVALRAASFTFESTVPGIFFESERAGNGMIDFLVEGNSLHYKIGNRGLVLGEFIMKITISIAG